MKGLKH